MQATSLRLRVARTGAAPNLEGGGPTNPKTHRLSHPHLLAISRADNLHGWTPASPSLRASHMAGIFHREMAGGYSHSYNRPPERRLDPTKRNSSQRECRRNDILLAPWRLPYRGGPYFRPGLSHRAVHSHNGFR